MEHFFQTWDARFLALAHHVSGWSKDPSTKVGAVIVRTDHTVVSLGYNGFPRGTEDYHQQLDDRVTRLKRTVHAEVNAILAAVEKLDGCILYVTPLHPCATCAGIIIQSGIKRVVARMAKNPHLSWVEDFKAATRMFKEAGIAVELITKDV